MKKAVIQFELYKFILLSKLVQLYAHKLGIIVLPNENNLNGIVYYKFGRVARTYKCTGWTLCTRKIQIYFIVSFTFSDPKTVFEV